MYLTRCPTCGERSATAEIGQVMACPRCPAKFAAEANEADNTREAFVEYVQAKIRPTGERLAFVGVAGAVIAVLIGSLLAFTQLSLTDHTTVFTRLITIAAVFLSMALLSGVVFLGAVQMQRVRHYPLCILAAVLAMLPFANLCFPIGWLHSPVALYWLRKPEVRKAFALNRGDD